MAEESSTERGDQRGHARPEPSELAYELELLRARLAESPRQMRALEDRLIETQARVASLTDRNERLADTLRDAREQLITLKEEIDRLAQPPSGYGVFLEKVDEQSVDIFTGGRKLRVAVSPEVGIDSLQHGQEVMLNEAMNIVEARSYERAGEVVML
jgi:proteasome-associated ATPase